MNLLARQAVLKSAAILLLLVAFESHRTEAGYATLVDNAYNNVVVAIGKNVDPDGALIATIQTLFRTASPILYTATGKRAYFGAVTIVGPTGFSSVKNPPRVSRAAGSQWQAPVASFESADFRIDSPNAAYGDIPYTQQSRGCGEPGDFIHLTTGFIYNSNSGNTATTQAKMLVNEWVKYRYGLFDENGYGWDTMYPVMYYGANGEIVNNTCNSSAIIWDETSTCSGKSPIEGLSNDCDFTPDTKPGANAKVNSSMMSGPVTSLATQYCTNSSNHNSDAPNKQNAFCKGQSIMEVVLQHQDFANGTNPPRDITPLSLNFTQVTSSNLFGLIVVSDPMNHNQTTYNVVPAIMKFIMVDLPTNCYFGVTQRDPQASEIYKFQQIKDSSGRNAAKTSVFGKFHEYTSQVGLITDTVDNAIDTLVHQADITRAILLLSNNATQDQLVTICTSANSSAVQLHLVTYVPAVFTAFKAVGCPGQVYLLQAETLSGSFDVDMKVCYSDLQTRAQLEYALMDLPNTISPDIYDTPTVFFEQMYLNETTNGTFYVDVPITSEEAIFYVETCANEVYGQIKISTLLNCTVGSQNVLTVDQIDYLFYDYMTLNSSGTWSFSVKYLKPNVIPYVVYAIGQPFTKSPSTVSQPDVLNTEAWAVAEEQGSWTKVRLFASVKNGTTPVFGAKVEATVTAADVAGASYKVILRDDGSGNPDISTNDGIYSAYFTNLDTSSRYYTVSVNVTNNDSAANYPTRQYPWITHNNDMSVVYTTQFQRTARADSFSAKGSSTAIPPGAINDFKVDSMNGPKIQLSWTAPGADLDHGTVTKYVFNCHTNKTYLTNRTTLDEMPLDTNIPSATPLAPGSTQTTSFNGKQDQTVHYCAVQAVDSGGKTGPISNAISYYIVSGGGLSTAATAGIVVGVILGIIIIIALVVLIWWCLARRDNDPAQPVKPTQETDESSKLKPIVQGAPIAVDSRSIAYQGENYQNLGARPQSIHSIDHSRHSGYGGNESDEDDNRSNYSKHTAGGMQTFQGKPVGIPVLPTGNSFPMQPMGNQYGSHPGLNSPGEQFDSTYIMQNADVAVPQRLAKLATIEDVGEYHDKNTLRGLPRNDDIQEYKTMPVYNHILNKPGVPLPPPRSASSSQSSLNNIGNQIPKNISQV